MDFGRVDDIDKVDFSLPKDDAITKELFSGLKKKTTTPEVYIGCAKWGRPDWIGKIYPKGTKQDGFLKNYVQHYNTIELNAMFYRLFPKETVQRWADTADDDFRFCPKFTQIITHVRRLKNADNETDALLDTYSVFGKKLGPSFIQLDDRFSPNQADVIHAYLKKLPRDFEVALEFRHPEWFENSKVVKDTFGLMKELGVISIITDTAGRRDACHMKLTTPKAFVRYVGNSLHTTDFKRMDEWIARIQSWLDSGLQSLYFFMHMHDELYSPELSSYMIEKLSKETGLHLRAPKLINTFSPPKLF